METLMAAALVLVADLVRSRDLSPEARRSVQQRIRTLTDGDAGFRFTGGDEFEWVAADAPVSLDRVLLLRARLAAGDGDVPGVQLRCGLGRGEVTVPGGDPYEQDGQAFHRAREAYLAVRGEGTRSRWSHEAPFRPAGSSTRWTALVDGRQDRVRDAVLLHMDGLLERWTQPQWQAIALVLEGRTYEGVGAELGISAQAVFRRLRAADLERYLEGHAAVKGVWS